MLADFPSNLPNQMFATSWHAISATSIQNSAQSISNISTYIVLHFKYLFVGKDQMTGSQHSKSAGWYPSPLSPPPFQSVL